MVALDALGLVQKHRVHVGPSLYLSANVPGAQISRPLKCYIGLIPMKCSFAKHSALSGLKSSPYRVDPPATLNHELERSRRLKQFTPFLLRLNNYEIVVD